MSLYSYFIGTLILSISLQQEVSAMVKQKCLYKVLLHRNLIPSMFLQQEISAMVKQKCLYSLLHRNLIPFISLQQEISAMVKQKCLYKVYFIGTLIPAISLQQEISVMVKQKSLHKVLLHRNFVTFYFCASRNQCTEVRFANFLSGGFITAIVVNPAERKMHLCAVQW
jgi:uncharacterized membrane protein